MTYDSTKINLITINYEYNFKQIASSQDGCKMGVWNWYLLLSPTKTFRFHGIEREQNRLPQNMPLWHVDCFELKAVKIQQFEEKLTSPLTT